MVAVHIPGLTLLSCGCTVVPMTATENTVPNRPRFTLVTSRLGVSTGSHPRTTRRSCLVAFDRLTAAGSADQGVIYEAGSDEPLEYLRGHF